MQHPHKRSCQDASSRPVLRALRIKIRYRVGFHHGRAAGDQRTDHTDQEKEDDPSGQLHDRDTVSLVGNAERHSYKGEDGYHISGQPEHAEHDPADRIPHYADDPEIAQKQQNGQGEDAD